MTESAPSIRAVHSRLPVGSQGSINVAVNPSGSRTSRPHSRVDQSATWPSVDRTSTTHRPLSNQVEKCSARAFLPIRASTAADSVAESLTTTRSPACRKCGSSRKRACVIEPGSETSSRTSSRASPRASGGRDASRSGGRMNVGLRVSTVMSSSAQPAVRSRRSDRWADVSRSVGAAQAQRFRARADP